MQFSGPSLYAESAAVPISDGKAGNGTAYGYGLRAERVPARSRARTRPLAHSRIPWHLRTPMQNEGLKALWERYCCRLLAFICGRIADESEAEDILQEVFIRIHRSLCCQDWNKPEGWIYQITRNLIIDHYRSRRETVEADETLPAPEECNPEHDPVTRLAFSLRETIDALPEPYREA